MTAANLLKHELPGPELLRQPHGNKAYILALARCLPGLAFKLEGWTPENFDIDRLKRASGPWATSEKVLVKFIVSVWNPQRNAGWVCDITDIASSINHHDRLVILQWMLNPVYP